MKKTGYFGLSLNKLIFALAAIAVITGSGFLSGQPYAEIAISAFSIVTLMYLVEGKPAGCVFGALYCTAYTVVCYAKGFYGLMFFNAFFAFPMYIIGIFTWNANKKGENVAARKLSAKKLLMVLAAAAVVFCGAYFICKATGSSNALFDALTLSLAAVGTLLLALRYVEQWYFNLAANLAVLVLWLIAAISDISNINFVICTSVFVVSNVMALISWLKMEKKQNEKNKKQEKNYYG
jgi:nicotinamide mononucleotide transporter PnuC